MTEPTTLVHVSEHVYWYSPDSRTDRPSLGAVVGAWGTVLLDVGASPDHTQGFLKALAHANISPIQFAVLTHWHWDHSFGAMALTVPILAHTLTAEGLRVQASYDWSDEALDQRVNEGREIAFCRDMLKIEMPDRQHLKLIPPRLTFTDAMTLDLGGVSCHIRHVGGDHADDSTVMYVPEDRVLFMGDCLYDNIYAPKRHYTPSKTRAMLSRLTEFEVEHYILGHHTELPAPAEIQGWIANLSILADLVDRHPQDAEAIRADFATYLGRDLTEDDQDDLNGFLAGLA